MHALSEVDLLALREHGRALRPLDLSLLAIHVAIPEAGQEEIVDWPVGRRNHALLQLHSLWFGSALRGWVECRGCREKLEFDFDVDALISKAYPDQPERIVIGEQTFRPPSSRDLAHVAREVDASTATLELARRCRLDSGPECSIEELDAISEAIALADPLGDVILHFDCPGCAESFDESVDLPAFVCAELESRARHLLRDIHTLASAYGWSERDILAVTAARRASYVEMICA